MSINMEKPIDLFKVPTVTYNAELEVMREMRDTVGLYKERQFSNNRVKVLTTIYEEIGQLWSIPIQYRPNFEVKDGVVTATTLFAEVQGMFEKKEKDYLKEVMSYVGENTIFLPHLPFVQDEDMTRKSDKLENERRKRALSCFLDKNTDVLDIEKLKDSDYYTYHVYSEEAQNLLNSKVQDLINLDWCKERLTKSDLVGKILDIAYSLPPTIMLMLHNYDLIGVPPKVVVFSGDELVCSLEDSILLMLLKLCGFDIVAFSPAGYSIFSRYIRGELYNKLVVGPFNCNMIGVDFSKVKAKNKK